MNRERKDGYAVTDKAQAIANLLYAVVVKIDCGHPVWQFADEVECLAALMRKNDQ